MEDALSAITRRVKNIKKEASILHDMGKKINKANKKYGPGMPYNWPAKERGLLFKYCRGIPVRGESNNPHLENVETISKRLISDIGQLIMAVEIICGDIVGKRAEVADFMDNEKEQRILTSQKEIAESKSMLSKQEQNLKLRAIEDLKRKSEALREVEQCNERLRTFVLRVIDGCDDNMKNREANFEKERELGIAKVASGWK